MRINETAGAGDATFALELFNGTGATVDLTGCVLRDGGDASHRFVLPATSLEAGEYLALDEIDLGFRPSPTASPFGSSRPARTCCSTPRGSKRFCRVCGPTAATGGNGPPRRRSARPTSSTSRIRWSSTKSCTTPGRNCWIRRPGEPSYAENSQEWIELYNRGTEPIDLTGWSLGGAIEFAFPAETVLPADGYLVVARDAAAMAAEYPALADILGDFDGEAFRLERADSAARRGRQSGRRGPLFRRRPVGRPGRRRRFEPGTARPGADNALREAWAASDEAAESAWRTYTYRGTAETTIAGRRRSWKEFALGLLDGAGEVLIDDIHVIESPATAPVELIQNGSFAGGSAAHWRLLGNHQHSEVIDDGTGNFVLHVVSTGATEYQWNQIETTLTGGRSVVDGREYEISFRAKWLSGSRQINSRLYFDRVARTTVLQTPEQPGTPGTQTRATSRISVPRSRTFGRSRPRPSRSNRSTFRWRWMIRNR